MDTKRTTRRQPKRADEVYLTNHNLAELPVTALDGARFNGFSEATPRAGTPEVYVAVQGSRQGRFKGEIGAKGLEGLSRVLRFSYGVMSPRDATTGQASGQRRHKPLVVTREPGAASPQYFQALVTNEVLPSVVIQILRGNRQGTSGPFQAVKLTNAVVTDFRQYVGDDGRWLEDVAFVFQKIEIENKPARTMAMDDWSVRGI